MRLTSVARSAFAAAAFASLILSSTPSFADNENEAKDLFARGREYRQKNDCGSAAPLFRKAYALFPQGLGNLRNLAECEEQLGHFASSRRAWLDLKRALLTAPPDRKYDGWEKDAEDSAARLKAKVASFVVDVYVKSPEGEALAHEKTGVEIFVNGESVGPTLVGTPLERDPGTYRIRAQIADAEPVEQIVKLSPGENPHVTIRLTRVPKPVAAQQPPGFTEPPPVEKASGGTRTIGWVLVGVGGAALVGGGITLLVRQSAMSDLDSQCPEGAGGRTCDPAKRADIESIVDRGKTMSTLSSILLPVGVVGVGAGIALIVTSRPSSSSGQSIVVTPTASGIDVSGRF